MSAHLPDSGPVRMMLYGTRTKGFGPLVRRALGASIFWRASRASDRYADSQPAFDSHGAAQRSGGATTMTLRTFVLAGGVLDCGFGDL